ncbi:Bifunctional nitrilase/nitrile hydratase NIT4A [Frankliniella fusca]|uniref:Bifunctional nitrilase/nitrile hydratase NIT4A n=1 Tax=Frankliniella fusca TaxID=407009 RepID=A0AAE1HBL4_9NEOP|nr:Bifunctional nitrilase/nitrile hydratase NIT4A [Frankliniella fusca]
MKKKVLRGINNVFSLLTFSTLPIVFGTLSMLADSLEFSEFLVINFRVVVCPSVIPRQVRSERLSLAVLAGVDVLGEALVTSKLRLMLITRAGGHQGRPTSLSMRAFGPLNRRAAFVALHRWYQYLQLLLGSG